MVLEAATAYLKVHRPRVVGGKPIKEWVLSWNRISKRSITARACFAPEFSSDHHGFVDIWYAMGCYADDVLAQNRWAGGMWYKGLLWRTLNGVPLSAEYVSPLAHHDELAEKDLGR
jgi:hypothetical protein